MAFLKEATRRGSRHPLWNKELFREEVENGAGPSIRSICMKWSSNKKKIQGLTNDVARWRKEDKNLDALCESKFGIGASPGRTPMETEDPDWRIKFCEEYLRTKSRVAAAKVTPFAYDSILRKLNHNRSEYDKIFADMLAETEARLLDRAEQIVHESLELEPSHRNKAWIALQLLKVRDRERYGDKIDVSVGGTVQHVLNRGKYLGELAESQEKFFEKSRPQLEASNVIDVEEVKESNG